MACFFLRRVDYARRHFMRAVLGYIYTESKCYLSVSSTSIPVVKGFWISIKVSFFVTSSPLCKKIMQSAIIPTFALLCVLVLQVSGDTRPIPRLQCPGHKQPVCTTDDANIRLTLRNECAFASLSIQDGSVYRILHRGPCKEHESTWSGWENDPDDIPANYAAYKQKNPNSTY